MTEQTKKLAELAKKAASNAYAPYSKFSVGAALVTKAGENILGCNVENASYGLGQCAERNAICSAVTGGAKPGDIKELVLYVDTETFISPCGACRQVIAEFMSSSSSVTTYNSKGESKHWTVAELLPDSFSSDDM